MSLKIIVQFYKHFYKQFYCSMININPIYFNFFVDRYLAANISVHHTYTLPEEDRRGCQIPWN